MINTPKISINFKSDLDEALHLLPCAICRTYHSRLKVENLEEIDFSNEHIFTLGVKFDPYLTQFICKANCYKDIFVLNRTPTYSLLNNMGLIEVPDCIKILNIYERMLIQRAKCFQTIIKLQTRSSNIYSGVAGSQGFVGTFADWSRGN
jgi:hypothetical protein